MNNWRRRSSFWVGSPGSSRRRWLKIGLAVKLLTLPLSLVLVSRSFATLVPGRTDRATLVGQTGSGKTTLAEYLCGQRPYVVAYDPKMRLEWAGYPIHRTLASVVQERAPRMIYRPTYEELENLDAVDEFFRWIYQRENTTLYVDELALVAHRDEYPYHYGKCLRQGRELNIETWTATQRPSLIPGIVLSEAEHLYVFTLRLERDRDRMEAETGIPAESIRQLTKHAFYYAPQSVAPVGPLTLALSGRDTRGASQEA